MLTTVFRVPKLGLTAEEVKIANWLKQPGDPVKAGEAFVVVETDKAALDIEAPQDGFLQRRYAEEGGVVAVGAELAAFAATRDEPAEALPQAPASRTAAPATLAPVPGDTPYDGGAAVPRDNPADTRYRASPAVRQRARERGIDLAAIVGTGPRGRIRLQDLENAAPPGAAQPAPAARHVEEIGRVRRATAQRMLASARDIPQFTLRRSVDVETVLAMRALLLESFRRAEAPLSITDFLLQASAHALMLHPDLRAQISGALEDGRVAVRDAADIGIAVATPAGLLVPVLQGVERMSLVEIAGSRREAVAAAQAGRLPARFAGQGCFTVSNLGAFDVDEFHALVNPGEAAIVAVGTIRQVPAVQDGQVVVRQKLTLTFTFDHRLVDGAEGAQFAKDLVDKLEGRDWRLV